MARADPRPLTAVQISSARSAVAAAGGTLESKSGELGLAQITSGSTAAGSSACSPCQWASSAARAPATCERWPLSARPGLPAARSPARRQPRSRSSGATLGSAAAFAAVIAWAPGSIGATLALVPWDDVLLILAGLPLAAAAAGWLLAGRQPPAISRQPLE